MNQSKDNISVFLLVRTVDEALDDVTSRAVYWTVDDAVYRSVDRAVHRALYDGVSMDWR